MSKKQVTRWTLLKNRNSVTLTHIVFIYILGWPFLKQRMKPCDQFIENL